MLTAGKILGLVPAGELEEEHTTAVVRGPRMRSLGKQDKNNHRNAQHQPLCAAFSPAGGFGGGWEGAWVGDGRLGWDFAFCHEDTLPLTLSFPPVLFSSPQQTVCGGGRGGGRRDHHVPAHGRKWVLPAVSSPPQPITIRSPPPDRQTRHPPLSVSWLPTSTVPSALTLSPEQDNSDTA